MSAMTVVPEVNQWYPRSRHRDSTSVKHHFMTHIASTHESHKLLLSCWVHERKHKEIKKYERYLNNTAGPSL